MASEIELKCTLWESVIQMYAMESVIHLQIIHVSTGITFQQMTMTHGQQTPLTTITCESNSLSFVHVVVYGATVVAE